jgi:hypothetical protein
LGTVPRTPFLQLQPELAYLGLRHGYRKTMSFRHMLVLVQPIWQL